MDISRPEISRREFLKFFGAATAGGSALVLGFSTSSALSACSTLLAGKAVGGLPFTPLAPTRADQLTLAQGFEAQRLIEYGTAINDQGERFGYDNDFLAFVPLDPRDPTDGLLWVNHESVHRGLVSADWTNSRERRFIEQEMKAVGGSILRVRRENGGWRFVPGDPLNRRLDAHTPMALVAPRAIEGSHTAIGTLANCCGGVTPWGTFLSAEENYGNFYGERLQGERTRRRSRTDFAWDRYYPRPPEHYGWIVEIEPRSGRARKLTALGRFAHEGATITRTVDGRVVAYMGDDSDDRCLYKFVSESPDSLEHGILYVADLGAGRWIPLVRERHPVLQKTFGDQLDVLIYAREAAKLVGGSPLDRPEDIEVQPGTGHVFVALTGNKSQGRPYGQILKLIETGDDPGADSFTSSTWSAGGPDSGFACPDNLAFDARGNLWFTCDVSGKDIGQPRYAAFGNNGLYYMPMRGPFAGQSLRVASAPIDAELTGPCFSPDGSALFLSVQHPGEGSDSPGHYTSHWPTGQGAPRPGVVAIAGPAFTALAGGAGA